MKKRSYQHYPVTLDKKSKELGITKQALFVRVKKYGWAKSIKFKKYDGILKTKYKGQMYSVKELSKKINVSEVLIYCYLKNYESLKDVIPRK